ncbi:hypothetical protein L6Q96_13605 [Candidatus Binatia bacterium]|nr:hypothetical protein [Candidatus Binatia bacterium]
MWLVVIALMLFAGLQRGPRCLAAEVEQVPAHWVDSEKVAPRNVTDFEWYGMHFVSPGRGWLVGYPMVLEIDGDSLRLWFVGRTWFANLWTVDAADASHVWAGGAELYRFGPERFSVRDVKSEGLFINWDGARCSAVEAQGIPSLSVGIEKLALGGPADGWAIARFEWETNVFGTLLLRFDGRKWEARKPGWPLGEQWSMTDLCLEPDGGGWLVGSRREGGDRRRPHAFRRVGGDWKEVPVPPIHYPSVRMDEVHCLDDGGAVVRGSAAFDDDPLRRDPDPVLWTFNGTWERVELPEDLRSVAFEALAVVNAQDYWLAVSDPFRRAGGEFFMHFSGGRWERVPGPTLPPDIAQRYIVRQVQFVSPTEGWAIARGSGAGNLSRGLIFHYKDGVWRVRNWSWNWWDEKWFGFKPM